MHTIGQNIAVPMSVAATCDAPVKKVRLSPLFH